MKVVLPEDDTGYCVMVQPEGPCECVVIDCNPRGHAFTSSVTESKVTLGRKTLIAKALAEGEKGERGDGIYCMKLQHSAGYYLVYRNETSDK